MISYSFKRIDIFQNHHHNDRIMMIAISTIFLSYNIQHFKKWSNLMHGYITHGESERQNTYILPNII